MSTNPRSYLTLEAALPPIDDSMKRLKHFRAAVRAGLPVHPDTLTWVADAFSKYIEDGEGLTLDEAFDCKPRQRVGNASQSEALKEARMRRCWAMRKYLHEHPEKTQTQAAEAVKDDKDGEKLDVDSMCRDYRAYFRDYKKWKLKQGK